jgi:hypothetical protein
LPFFFREWQRRYILTQEYPTARAKFKRAGLHYTPAPARPRIPDRAAADPTPKILETQPNLRKSG